MFPRNSDSIRLRNADRSKSFTDLLLKILFPMFDLDPADLRARPVDDLQEIVTARHGADLIDRGFPVIVIAAPLEKIAPLDIQPREIDTVTGNQEIKIPDLTLEVDED